MRRRPAFYKEPDVGYGVHRLHFNENLFLPEEYYREIAAAASLEGRELRFYTEPNSTALSRAIEAHFGLPEGSVAVAAGADDVLRSSLALLHYADEEKLAAVEPTYSMARILAEQAGLAYVPVYLDDDLSLNVDEAVKAGRGGGLYVCSPNNPTANLVKELEELAARLEGILIYDAAYAEFAGLWRPQLYEYGNVIEVRTFSKAWGLAGARVGYGIAKPELAESLKAVSLPHPISASSAKAVAKALELENYVKRAVEQIADVRSSVAGRIKADKYVGPVNFITLKAEGAEAVADELYRARFAVRALGGKKLCESCLRFTLAPMPVMERLLSTLRELGVS